MTAAPPPANPRRGRGWAYSGALLGGAVSIAANVAHSYVPPPAADPGWSPQPGAVVGAVFWPVALLVAVEILARTTWPAGPRWKTLRLGGLGPVAAVAAAVSYRHLSGLLAYYHEDPLTTRLGPLAVDGLMIMATGALIATAHTTHRPTTPASADTPTAPIGHTADTPDTPADTAPDTAPDTADIGRADGRTRRTGRRPDTTDGPPRPGRTGTAIARLREREPGLSTTQIAARLGVSDRTVRRHLTAPAEVSAPAGRDTPPAPARGGELPGRLHAVPTTPTAAPDEATLAAAAVRESQEMPS